MTSLRNGRPVTTRFILHVACIFWSLFCCLYAGANENVSTYRSTTDRTTTDRASPDKTLEQQLQTFKELSFGIVPQQSAQKIAQTWGPLLTELTHQLGLPVRFRTAPNIPDFEHRLAAGEYDIAYMNPYHYTVFSGEKGYRAIAKARNKKIEGIMLVHKDSPYQSLEDLKGLTLAFPAPAAFAASVLPRAELIRRQISFEAAYVQNHDSVYINVARGKFAAGGGVQRTLKSMPAEIQEQLRILWKTPTYTPHAVAVRADLPASLTQRIQNALVTVNSAEQLAPLQLEGFMTATDSDWNDIRALGIDLLKTLQKE